MPGLEKENELSKEIIQSNLCYSNLQELCEIGHMFAGSPTETRGADHILGYFKDHGLTRIREARTPYLGWARVDAKVEITAPVKKPLSPWTLVYSPSSRGPIESDLIFARNGSRSSFQAISEKAADKVVMVDSSSPVEQGREIHRRDKFATAVALGASAFLYVNHLPGHLRRAGSLRTNRLAEIPGVAINYEEGYQLQRMAETANVRLRMEVTTRAEPSVTRHVMGEIPGTALKNEVVIVSAHYDSHDISPGAIDNKCSVAALLDIVRAASALGLKPLRTIRFMCLSAEEFGVTGSSIYTRSNKQELRDAVLMINLHHIGVPGGIVMGAQGYDDLLPELERIRLELSLEEKCRFGIKHNSDTFSFVAVGVPAVPISGKRFPEEYALTEADTIDKIDSREIAEGTAAAARVILRLANSKSPALRHRTTDETIESLRRHGVESILQDTGQWKFFFEED